MTSSPGFKSRQARAVCSALVPLLVVRKGHCEIDIYDDEQTLVATLEMTTGDVMVMVSGGHGFRMLEDTVFLEIKQGPYTGIDEKKRF